MWTLLFAAASAAPLPVPATVAPAEPLPSFEWPKDTSPCRATLVLGADGAVAKVAPDGCADALGPVLDGLVGRKVAGGPGVAEVRLVPPIEGTTATPDVRPLPIRPTQWPTKWPDALATVPPGTTCAAELTWTPGEPPTTFALTTCPPAMAKALEKAAKVAWTGPAIDAPEGLKGTVGFAWIEDPNNPSRRLLVIEGAAMVRTQVAPAFPQGTTGGATCTAAVHLEPNGAPSVVRVFGCPPPWNSAARSAVQKWSFYPRLVDGQLLPDDEVIQVNFSLE